MLRRKDRKELNMNNILFKQLNVLAYRFISLSGDRPAAGMAGRSA